MNLLQVTLCSLTLRYSSPAMSSVMKLTMLICRDGLMCSCAHVLMSCFVTYLGHSQRQATALALEMYALTLE